MFYNFVCIYQTLAVTSAMEPGISDNVCSFEIVALWRKNEKSGGNPCE
jgi:hypothetical protein